MGSPEVPNVAAETFRGAQPSKIGDRGLERFRAQLLQFFILLVPLNWAYKV